MLATPRPRFSMVCCATTKADSISVLTDRDALKHAIALPKTRLTARPIATRLIRCKRSDIGGPQPAICGRAEAFKMSRRKIDSYSTDFDGNWFGVDREEFPIKSGKYDLARAVRMRPNRSRGD